MDDKRDTHSKTVRFIIIILLVFLTSWIWVILLSHIMGNPIL